MAGEGAVRSGIDEHHAVAREHLAQRDDRGRRMDRRAGPSGVLDVVEPRPRLDGGEPLPPARLALLQRGTDHGGAVVHQVEEGVAASGHHVAEIAVGGELVHVDIDVDHARSAALAHGPVHRIALVETGAEHHEAGELVVENGVGGVAGAGVAEDAERQRVVLREHPLGAQRGGDRDRPALGQHLQARRRGVVLDSGADQESDPAVFALRIRERAQRGVGGPPRSTAPRPRRTAAP